MKLPGRIMGQPYFVKSVNSSAVYDVVLSQSADRTNLPAEDATRSLIEDFRPHFLFLVGIAGVVENRDDLQLGDVIVPDYVEYHEFRKMVGGKSVLRRVPLDHPSYAVRSRITQPRCNSGQWLSSVDSSKRPVTGQSKALVGNLVSGEKLLGDPSDSYQQMVLKENDKALAVDMESYGFCRAVYQARSSVHYNPQCAIIRGISDETHAGENNAMRPIWRPYAAHVAAVFCAGVIAEVLESWQ